MSTLASPNSFMSTPSKKTRDIKDHKEAISLVDDDVCATCVSDGCVRGESWAGIDRHPVVAATMPYRSSQQVAVQERPAVC